MSIKTNFEFPRGEDPADVIKQGQRLAQDLSKNFKSIKKEIDSIINEPVILTGMTKYIDLTFSFTSGSPLYQSVTMSHNLGSIPTGWFIVDAYRTGTGVTEGYSVIRTGWDANNLTLQNMVNMGNVLKVRVFI